MRDALARGQSGLSEGFVALRWINGHWPSANAFMFGIKGCENKLEIGNKCIYSGFSEPSGNEIAIFT